MACLFPYEISGKLFETSSDQQLRTDTAVRVVEQLSDEYSEDNDNLERVRKQSGKELLIAHLNINSIQNKFEELTNVMKAIRVHIMFVSETKIDSSYPNAQFSLPGYSLYRNDRKKGGGGILVRHSRRPDSNLTKIIRLWKLLQSM